MLGWGGGVWKNWWERKETQPWLPALSFHACNFGWGVGALPFCWDQTDSCFFLRCPKRMGPRTPKPMILSAIGSQAEGTKSSPSSSGQPFTHSPGMQLQGQSPVSSLFLPNFFPCCHGREKPFPPPSLTCPKSWRQKGTQSLERFLWDKSRKTPENGLLTTRGLWRGALSATHQAGFCYLLLGDYRPNCQFWEVIGLTFLPGPGTVFFCVSFLHQTWDLHVWVH